MNKLYPPYLEARLDEINKADAIEEKRLVRRIKRIKIRFLKEKASTL